ncbi:unnamed protein product [Periconia digitata]|uniref:Uncharacterized protein n=1 Tax=Periconia digitata TaxID=1303443 RepID=A0A9W4U8A1_9PLEO|nr:unnamed protein product [Periconia digitata]
MKSLRTTLAFTVSSLAAAQWLDDKALGSCRDIECPGTNLDACPVSNQTYVNIGVDTFPYNSSSSQSNNLTWTIGVHVYDVDDPDDGLPRVVEKAFFLGTPEGLNLTTNTDRGGCAVLMETYDLLQNSRTPIRQRCEQTIGEGCHKELQDNVLSFAKDQGNQFNGSSDACDGLEQYLWTVSGDGSKCAFDWRKVHYIPLIGPSAPKALTEEQNSTTECYPTRPTTNDLTLVQNWNNSGTIWYNDTTDMLNSLNLALTVFWDKNGDADVKTQDSHVSCLWPLYESVGSDKNKNSGSGPKESGSTERTQGTMWAVMSVALVAIWGLL